MVTSARRHYQVLLGDVYRWSVAAGGDPFERGRAWLDQHGLAGGDRYLDLGAGFGTHTVPLARAGKTVTAVDFDGQLLAQLDQALGPDRVRVTAVHADLGEWLPTTDQPPWDVVVCAGDTITHLADHDAARALVEDAAAHLTPGGALAVELRDSTGFAARGADRFIEVARDAGRIMHCLLEPIDQHHLRVTDLVTDVTPDGPRTRISDYLKLRLAPATVIEWAAAAGLTLERRGERRGLVTLVMRSAG